MVRIEVVYVLATKEVVQRQLEVPAGTTVAIVLEQSGLFTDYPETQALSVGIFSKTIDKDYVVQAGDRIEVYRDLTLDPMEKRRKRVKK